MVKLGWKEYNILFEKSFAAHSKHFGIPFINDKSFKDCVRTIYNKAVVFYKANMFDGKGALIVIKNWWKDFVKTNLKQIPMSIKLGIGCMLINNGNMIACERLQKIIKIFLLHGGYTHDLLNDMLCVKMNGIDVTDTRIFEFIARVEKRINVCLLF